MSILSIDENTDILTCASLIRCIRWTLVDDKFRHKLRLNDHLDPGNPDGMEDAISAELDELLPVCMFMPIAWTQIFKKIIKLRYTKGHPGFQIRFKIMSWHGFAWESRKNAEQYLDVKVIRTSQHGQLIETVNVKVWFKNEYHHLIEEYSSAIKNTMIQL